MTRASTAPGSSLAAAAVSTCQAAMAKTDQNDATPVQLLTWLDFS